MARPAGAPAPLDDAASQAWARRMAGPLTAEEIAEQLGCDVVEVTGALTRLRRAADVRSRTALVAAHTLAGHLTAHNLGAPGLDTIGDLGPEQLVLLRLSAGYSTADIAAELGTSRATVSNYRTDLLARTGLAGVHQVVGLGCLAGIVRPADVYPDREYNVTAPPPAYLATLVDRARCALADTGRALVVAPRAEQAGLARAVAGREAGAGTRVLAVTPYGEHWTSDVATLAATRSEAGHVVVLLTRSEAERPGRPPTPPGASVVTSLRGMRRLVGTTLPATVITTPAGLEILAAAHPSRPFDLSIALDDHLPQVGERVGRHPTCPPVRAVLRLTSTPRLTATGRTRHEGCDPYTTGPITAKLTPRQAVEAARLRPYRIAAAAAPGPRGEGLGDLVLALASTHHLARVVVHGTNDRDAARLAKAITDGDGRHDGGVQVDVLPAGHDAEHSAVVSRFRHGPHQLRVLVTGDRLPAGLDADAVIHTTGELPAARTAAIVEAALTPADPGRQRPLLLIVADSTAHGRWEALSTLTAALAALDPDLKKDLRRARTIGGGWPGLELALPLPAGADEQRARAVCAWADTTVAEEMRDTAERARATDTLHPDLLSPTGLRLSAWRAVRRTAALPSGPPSNRPLPSTSSRDTA
ncbi:LuxR C-terminal-related transcriptional regulator [Kitasatospora sp. NPDC098663]|uniref:LuxR C-terminal-related transcriptional regulator n=1 Tax=Kitasatospora sp. NPDC098663 TaxID=3364096 RepID=UPI00381FA246